MKILLVEDDYLLGRSMAQLLERAGAHRVRFTHKAADVFRLCQAGMVELVIMDVNLPGTFWEGEEVTGVDLSRMLKQHPQTAHLPIMLLSADAMGADVSHLLHESLADDLYGKPIADADDFLRRLNVIAAGGGGFQGVTVSAS